MLLGYPSFEAVSGVLAVTEGWFVFYDLSCYLVELKQDKSSYIE